MKHGLCRDPLYKIWKGIKTRCYNPNVKAYPRYGGRGIRMCGLWKNDPEEFIFWAKANGWRRGLQINRKDNDRGYAPWNCNFVTNTVNQNNRKCTKWITIGDETKSIRDWFRDPRCVIDNLNTFEDRIYTKGWSPEKALLTPVMKGELHKSSKITEDDVREIRRKYRKPTEFYRSNIDELAEEFGIRRQSIDKILNGVTWKHVK